jgi:alkanesulfonate monooxygenase SsuD/methylene tetrahydromethanopterin reductase-like flavin-dependent oxidoreductase (luciferase family)
MLYSVMSVQDHYPGRGRSVPEFYAEVMAQGERADALGYDAFFLAEHHFHEYGAVPDPSVFLASLAQRTRRLRLGTSISVLTFRNPLTVAETYSMVDILSGGRLVLGVGSGYLKHEFEGFRIDPAEKRERFDESLEVLTKALSGERFSFHGKYLTVNDVAINIMPLQTPTPPIYLATLRREGAYHIGSKGQKMMCVPYASKWAPSLRNSEKGSRRPASNPMMTTSSWHCMRMLPSMTARRVSTLPLHSSFM